MGSRVAAGLPEHTRSESLRAGEWSRKQALQMTANTYQANEEVSVVVVAHDDWPHVELAVASALQQTHRPLEVIVVDNDSADGTGDRLVALFGETIRYVRQDNRLDGGGYNTGIRLAKGDFIQLLDGDDVLAPNKLEKQLAVFRADPSADIVYSETRCFNSDPGKACWVDGPAVETNDMLTALCEHGGNVGLTITSMFRRRVFDTVGYFDESIYGADYDFWFRAAAAGMRFRLAPGTLAFYRRWPGQMSLDRTRMLRRAEQTFEKAFAIVVEPQHRRSLANHLARVRFWRAMLPQCGLEKGAARLKLRQARASSAHAVPLPLFWAASAALALPGGRELFTSNAVRALGRRLRRMVTF